MHADSHRRGKLFARYTLVAGAASTATLAALAATLPDAAADPTSTPTTSATSAPTTTSAPGAAAGPFHTDDSGYVGSAARCDASEVAVAFGRTSRALVAICVKRDGQLEYRGVRLSDQAAVSMPAGRTADGSIVASNDAVTYVVSPRMLLVSEGDTVLYRDPWVEYREPRFADSATGTSSSTAPTSSTAKTASPTTVSTTTVTLAPSGPAGN